MDGTLERLIYFSRALVSGPSWRVGLEMEALLRAVRLRNAYWCVTGMLLFHEDCFAQILEGESEDLTGIFAAITADPRHCEVTLLQRAPVRERAFAGWSMHYIEPASPLGRPGESLFLRLASVAHGGA